MRYATGGGLDGKARARREAVRLAAAAEMVAGADPRQIARKLHVTRKSAYAWRKQAAEAGMEALKSKGASGAKCRLSPKSQAKLAAMLEQGPAAHGWDEDQMWTGRRVATLIGRKFHVAYSVSGATRLMRRLGFTPQVPARRAAQRDEAAIEAWKEATWAEIKGSGRRSTASFASKTRPAASNDRRKDALGEGAAAPRW